MVFSMKECPKCGVVNLDTAEHCDCAYDFVLDPMRSGNTEAKRAIRRVLRGIAYVVGVVWLFAPITRYPGPAVFIASSIVLLACVVGLSLLGHGDDMYR